MNKNFKINVDNTLDFDLTEHDVSSANIVKENASKYHVVKNNKTFDTEVIDSNFLKKTYKVKVNNNIYNININNNLDQLIKQMGFEVGATKLVNEIKAPMPGLILDVAIKVGQVVNENDTLLILEAMKMENVISSPREGTIKSISVKKGDAVEKNQLLIEFS